MRLFIVTGALLWIGSMWRAIDGSDEWFIWFMSSMFCWAVVYIGGGLEQISKELKNR